MLSYGIPQAEVAPFLGIDSKTLRKYFKREIKIAGSEANAKIAKSLFKMAVGTEAVIKNGEIVMPAIEPKVAAAI